MPGDNRSQSERIADEYTAKKLSEYFANLSKSQARKIPLDTKVYCPSDVKVRNEDPNCDHDYPPGPMQADDDGATWKCTKCGCETTVFVWE